MMSRVLTALPALVAAYGGVAVYIYARDDGALAAIVALVVLIAVGTFLLKTGEWQLGSQPELGVVLMSGWIVALIAAGAGLTALFLWVGLELPDWITSGKVTDEVKEMSKVLLGAVTAFAGVLFTEDLDKADGDLWPSTKTKIALGEKFEGRFDGQSPEYQAVYEDRVRPRGDEIREIKGWGFTARRKRAKILAAP